MKRLLFLGSKPIGHYCLSYLIDHSAELGIEIAGVLSNDNPRFNRHLSVRQLAIDKGLRFIEELDAITDEPKVDFLLSVQYHSILKPRHISCARDLAINLHMAPLPEYRGCNQFSFAIFDKAEVFGTTLHRLESGIDNGDIIAERRFPIPKDCFVNELYEITYQASVEMFRETIGNILAGRYELTPQASLVGERGTALHFRKEISELKTIDLAQDADTIFRRVRATSMPGFEPPYALVGGQKIYLIPEQHYPRDHH